MGCRHSYLNRSTYELKDAGLCIVGAAGETERTAYETDLTMPQALVLGAEGKSLRRLIREHCDFLVKPPGWAGWRASIFRWRTGVLLYEVLRQWGAA